MLRQVMAWTVHPLRFPAGGLSCCKAKFRMSFVWKICFIAHIASRQRPQGKKNEVNFFVERTIIFIKLLIFHRVTGSTAITTFLATILSHTTWPTGKYVTVLQLYRTRCDVIR